jgi:hypothetical protein
MTEFQISGGLIPKPASNKTILTATINAVFAVVFIALTRIVKTIHATSSVAIINTLLPFDNPDEQMCESIKKIRAFITITNVLL